MPKCPELFQWRKWFPSFLHTFTFKKNLKREKIVSKCNQSGWNWFFRQGYCRQDRSLVFPNDSSPFYTFFSIKSIINYTYFFWDIRVTRHGFIVSLFIFFLFPTGRFGEQKRRRSCTRINGNDHGPENPLFRKVIQTRTAFLRIGNNHISMVLHEIFPTRWLTRPDLLTKKE